MVASLLLFAGSMPGSFQAELFQSKLNEALFMGQNQPVAPFRKDSKTDAVRLDAIGNYRVQLTAHYLDDLLSLKGAGVRIPGYRWDSAKRRHVSDSASSISAGLYMARQVEYIYQDILREELPKLNAEECFNEDTTVPPGWTEHTVRRLYGTGNAAIYEGGQRPTPQIGLQQQEEKFPIKHLVDAFSLNYFELLTSGVTNISLIQESMRNARTAIAQLRNRLVWEGSAYHKLYGVINYPWLAKRVSATNFVTGANVDSVLAEINRAANYPQENSKQAFMPNAMALSPRLHNFLVNTRMGTYNDTSILTYWLKNNSLRLSESNIFVANELQGVGPDATYDGLLFYRKERNSLCYVVSQPFSSLPPQQLGLENYTVCYSSYGGVVMRNAGNNVLTWIKAAT